MAREVGLAPATLVQRFGSKRGLIVAMAKSGLGGDAASVAGLRAAHGSPLAVLREFLLCFAGPAGDPAEMANHLAFLQMDLTDPALRRITRQLHRDRERTVAELVERAADAGALRGADPAELGRLLLTVVSGALLTWAIDPVGPARDHLAAAIDPVLRPYLAPSRKPSRR